MTIITGKSAAMGPLRKGRTKDTKSALAAAIAAPIVAASRREFDPSNHSASVLHATPATTKVKSSVTLERNERRIINEFPRAHTECAALLR
jgi:hypothetical protein